MMTPMMQRLRQGDFQRGMIGRIAQNQPQPQQNMLSPMQFMYQPQQNMLMPQMQGTSYNPAFAQSVRGMMPNFASQQMPQMQPQAQVQAPQNIPLNIRDQYMNRFRNFNFLGGRM